MTLKIETKTFHYVDAWDLESFVRVTYGVDFSFMADQESGDDTSHEFEVDGVVDKWDQEKVDELLQGGYPSFMADSLLNYMARAGLIPFGRYLVRVN